MKKFSSTTELISPNHTLFSCIIHYWIPCCIQRKFPRGRSSSVTRIRIQRIHPAMEFRPGIYRPDIIEMQIKCGMRAYARGIWYSTWRGRTHSGAGRLVVVAIVIVTVLVVVNLPVTVPNRFVSASGTVLGLVAQEGTGVGWRRQLQLHQLSGGHKGRYIVGCYRTISNAFFFLSKNIYVNHLSMI